MNSVQKWTRLSFIWMFSCSCLPLLFLASPLPLKEGHAHINHTCVLENDILRASYIRNRTFDLAKLARLSDTDTENRFFGDKLYANVEKKDRCYLMMRVTDIVVTDVLSKLNNKYPSLPEVTCFLTSLNMKLNDCKPLGCKECLERNLEEMKNKMTKLGENGKNKIVGELDMLFDYLEMDCTEVSKETSKSKKN